jgi:glutathione synthase/RimK-type ligase-like ATP-grasp enzyme
MLVIIYPTGTKRSIHLNHFIVEAEKADPDCRVITTDEFVKTHLDTWPSDTVFIIRVGSHYINDILPTLTKMWHDGKYTVFPNVPAIKNCVRKSYFYELCKQNNIKIPDTIAFNTDGPDWRSYDFTKFGECVIKPSIGSLGSGIYFLNPEQVPDKIESILYEGDEFYEDGCDIIVQKRIKNKKNIPESIRVFCFNGEPTCSITLSNISDLQDKAGSNLKVDPSILYDENGNVLDAIGNDLEFDTVSNLNKGGIAGPYFADEKLKDICRKICKMTGIEFTTIDFVQDENDEYYCLEANIAPHLYRGFIIYNGKINHPRMIFEHVLDKKHKGSIIL